MAEIVHLCVVQIHTRTFQRIAISGKSFSFPPQNSANKAYRAVQVRSAETGRIAIGIAYFHYVSRSLRYWGAAFKENFMAEENKCCETCSYHDDFSWVCFYPESEYGGDFTDNKHICGCWTSRRENNARNDLENGCYRNRI